MLKGELLMSDPMYEYMVKKKQAERRAAGIVGES
jgi:hypothetical protein